MKWTKTQPTKPGYYWVKLSAFGAPTIKVAQAFSTTPDGKANLFYVMGDNYTVKMGDGVGHVTHFSDESICPPTEEKETENDSH